MDCNSLITNCFRGLLYPPKLYPIFNRTKIQHLFNNNLPHPIYKFIPHLICFAFEKITKVAHTIHDGNNYTDNSHGMTPEI